MFLVKIQTHSRVLLWELCSCCSECLSQHTENKDVWVLASAEVQEAVRHLSTELCGKRVPLLPKVLTSHRSHYRSSGISTRILTTSQISFLCSESHSGADLSSQTQISAGWSSKQPRSSGPFGIPSLTHYLQPGSVHKECKHISKCFSQLTCQTSQQGICISGIEAFCSSHRLH